MRKEPLLLVYVDVGVSFFVGRRKGRAGFVVDSFEKGIASGMQTLVGGV